MAWISEFPDDGGETGGGGTSETQRSPLPKSRVKKRSREPDGNTATADTIDPNRKKAATTMPVPTTVRTESAQTDRPCSTGSSSSVSSKKKLRFQLPTGIQKHPKPPQKHARSRDLGRARWRETSPGSGCWIRIRARAGPGQIRSDTDSDTDSEPEHDGIRSEIRDPEDDEIRELALQLARSNESLLAVQQKLEEQRAARHAAELNATQAAHALQQAHMEQQTLAEERAARFAAEQFATQISYMLQQEVWGRTALEDRILTGSQDLEQLRQAASRYWTESQDALTTQTTKLAQLRESQEQQRKELDARSQEMTKEIERLTTAVQYAEERTKAVAAAATQDAWTLSHNNKELQEQYNEDTLQLQNQLDGAAEKIQGKDQEIAALQEELRAIRADGEQARSLPDLPATPKTQIDSVPLQEDTSNGRNAAAPTTSTDAEQRTTLELYARLFASNILAQSADNTRRNVTIEVAYQCWEKQEEQKQTDESPAPQMTETEALQAVRDATRLLKIAASRAKVYDERICMPTTDWQEILQDVLYDTEVAAEKSRMATWFNKLTGEARQPFRCTELDLTRLTPSEIMEYTGIADPIQMQFWASREGRLFDVAAIIAKNEARAYAARHRLQWLADTPMGDEDTRASRATTPTKMTAEKTALGPDQGAAPEKYKPSTPSTTRAPNNHEAGRIHDQGTLGNGAAIETEENRNKGDDKASPAHPAPPATTAAAKETRESDEDAVTSRAATPDKKKEEAKVIAMTQTAREDTPPMAARKTALGPVQGAAPEQDKLSTPSTTQTARGDTPLMAARSDETGEGAVFLHQRSCNCQPGSNLSKVPKSDRWQPLRKIAAFGTENQSKRCISVLYNNKHYDRLVPTGPREFVLSHVFGDGRCLWRAMADALADDTLDRETQTKKADELCRQVADYLTTEEGCCTTVRALIESGGDNIEAYCTKMKRCEQEAHWGGEAELLAMSRLLEAHIELYTTAESTKNDGVVNATPTPVPGDLKATAATPHSATPELAGDASMRESDEDMSANDDTEPEENDGQTAVLLTNGNDQRKKRGSTPTDTTYANNPFALLADMSIDEAEDPEASDLHEATEGTTPDDRPEQQEAQQPTVRDPKPDEIKAVLDSIKRRDEWSPEKSSLRDLQHLENILGQISDEETTLTSATPTQEDAHTAPGTLSRTLRLSIVGDPRLRELTALRLETESLFRKGAILWIDLAQTGAPPQPPDAMEVSDGTLQNDIDEHPERVTYRRLRDILAHAEQHQARALLKQVLKPLKVRLLKMDEEAQAEGFTLVPDTRKRQAQPTSTKPQADPWEAAHALAAEVGAKLTDLDRTHFSNLQKARALTKTKHQKHDRDPRTKQ